MSLDLERPPRSDAEPREWEQWNTLLWEKLKAFSEAMDVVAAGGAIGDHKLWFSPDLPTIGIWVWCDGASYLRATYPEFFAIYGTRFGAADATHFNVIDSNGRFLRFWDNASGRDPDKATRTAMKPGGATGNEIGSIQGDQNKAHTHGLVHAASGQPLNTWTSGPYAMPAANGFAANVNWSDGGEARPINFYGALIVRLA